MTAKNLLMVCEAKLAVSEAADDKEPSGRIEATVTTWGPREGEDGRKFFYKPEGFADWAKQFSGEGKPLPMFVNHDADAIPVGEWTAFVFTDEGMTAEGRLYMNTSMGSDLYTVMKESPSMFGGVSVGAYAEEFCYVKEDGDVFPAGSGDYYEDGYFQIVKGGLREVSVVMYPNNTMAEVHKLEYFRADGKADLRVLEQVLRDAGLIRKDAVAAASIFKKIIEQRDVVNEILEIAPQQRDSDAEATTDEILAALQEREILKALTNRLKG